MNGILLKFRFLLFAVFLLSVGVQAQNSSFIYIQAENKQPFYVKMDKVLLNSSETGYIIIPKLTEDTYQLTIGFPKSQWPEQDVTVNVKDAKAGYLLKKSAAGVWSIANLEPSAPLTQKDINPANEEFEIIPIGGEFARILAEVVNDPSIAQRKVAKKITDSMVKPVEIKENESVVIKEKVEPEPIPSDNSETVKASIRKLPPANTAEGLLITYLDITGPATDTIKIYIPSNQLMGDTKNKNQIDSSEIATQKVDSVKKDARFIDMELQNPNQKIDSGTVVKDDFVITERKAVLNNAPVTSIETKVVTTDTTKNLVANNCNKTATQTDFLLLRKNMAAETNEKDMVKTATGQFIKTCFATEQIKNLGVLFISEEERYNFYVAAYAYVTDTNNFETLEDQLTDEYYKTRFKAMINH